MLYKQFMYGSLSMSNGVQSFVHIDDAVETVIQVLSFEPNKYN